MTKEELLRTYLEDDIFTENGYLKEGEAKNFKWSDNNDKLIIEVLKTIIKEESNGKGYQTITGFANRILDHKL